MSELIEKVVHRLRRIANAKTAKFRHTYPTVVIGGGGIAPVHINGYEDSGYCHPIGVCDISIAAIGNMLLRFPDCKGFIDIDTMLADFKPKIASVCTWPQSHLQVVQQVANAGVMGVLCEKPLTLRYDEAIAMKEFCDARNVKLGGAHQYRFSDPFRIVATAISKGELGKIRSIRGAIKSTVANNGPHLIDSIRFILGDRPLLRLRCEMERNRNEFNRGYPAEDASESQLVFDGGIQVDLAMGDAASDFFQIEIESDKGKVTFSPKEIQSTIPLPKPNPNPRHAHPRMFREFVDWVIGKNHSYAASSDQALMSVEAMLAHYHASKFDQWIDLPLTNLGDVIKERFPVDGTIGVASQNPVARINLKEGLVAASERSLVVDGKPPTLRNWFSVLPRLGKEECVRVANVVKSGKLSSTGGTEVTKLERSMAKMYKVPGAVASTSGTSALHVALATWNPDPGSEVITTPVTDMGSIIPILACNCIPVFADIDPITGNMTAETIAAKLTDRTRAVILVHLFGRPADVHGIKKLLDGRGIALIEDCSQAHYADASEGKVGTIGDFGCFSFQQSKQITCGDGGVTLINNPEMLKRASLFVDKGWDRAGGGRSHLFFGMNYRMTEMQGAIANVQLKRLPDLIHGRRESADQLTKKLESIEGIALPKDLPGARSSWWVFHFMFQRSKYILNAEMVAGLLSCEGIKCRNGYLPRPMFDEIVLKERATYGNSGYPLTQYGYKDPVITDYPGTKGFLDDSILIGWSPDVKQKHIDGIAKGIETVMKALKFASR
jgi:dTDP-4-amino-4,6-dideoxygalactose transaminase/predicted dehydrogenase